MNIDQNSKTFQQHSEGSLCYIKINRPRLGGRGNERAAFTLAEVLITLGIIGIVAAMTMPTLIQNNQKKQTAIKVKKAYSMMAQVFERSKADNGDPFNWEIPDFRVAGNSQKFADTYIVPYLDVIKRCNESEVGDCKLVINNLNGSNFNFASPVYAKYFIKDGSMIVVTPSHGNMGIRVYVDINGAKAPNTWGKDVFYFSYTRSDASQDADVNGRFLPNSSQATVEYLLTTNDGEGCNKSAQGWGCAALIMKQNWEITKDYPW